MKYIEKSGIPNLAENDAYVMASSIAELLLPIALMLFQKDWEIIMYFVLMNVINIMQNLAH